MIERQEDETEQQHLRRITRLFKYAINSGSEIGSSRHQTIEERVDRDSAPRFFIEES